MAFPYLCLCWRSLCPWSYYLIWISVNLISLRKMSPSLPLSSGSFPSYLRKVPLLLVELCRERATHLLPASFTHMSPNVLEPTRLTLARIRTHRIRACFCLNVFPSMCLWKPCKYSFPSFVGKELRTFFWVNSPFSWIVPSPPLSGKSSALAL